MNKQLFLFQLKYGIFYILVLVFIGCNSEPNEIASYPKFSNADCPSFGDAEEELSSLSRSTSLGCVRVGWGINLGSQRLPFTS